MKIEKCKLLHYKNNKNKPYASAVFAVYKTDGDYYYQIGIIRIGSIDGRELYDGRWQKTKDGFLLIVD